MTTVLYGIANCDTIKKAKKWLTENNIEFQFHDYRKQGLSKEWLQQAEAELGWETILNKRGTTFRQLDDEIKQDLNKDKAVTLLMAHPAMIKRPILEHNDVMICGFKAQTYAEVFA